MRLTLWRRRSNGAGDRKRRRWRWRRAAWALAPASTHRREEVAARPVWRAAARRDGGWEAAEGGEAQRRGRQVGGDGLLVS